MKNHDEGVKSNTHERVRIIIRPWKAIDGTVNKPTLRTMLQSLLTHLMTKPGVTFEDVCKKYSPIIQAVPLLELLEMLEEIGCIETRYVLSNHKSSMFSKRASYKKKCQ